MGNNFIFRFLLILLVLLCLSLSATSSSALAPAHTLAGTTERVSVASDGTQGNSLSGVSSISANGRYVVLLSYASNLVDGDSNHVPDVFVHDRVTGETTRVSIASDGTQGNNISENSSISADGRYVAFDSQASNLVDVDTNESEDIFVHDQVTAETRLVSVASDGTQGNNWSTTPSISADGRYVAFISGATNLVDGDSNGVQDIFVHDRVTGETRLVSVASDGTQGNSYSDEPSISADGRYVAFYSHASNLVYGDTNETWDVFVHDRVTGETTRVSVASDGTQGNYSSEGSSISADGRFVGFLSLASNLVYGDTNQSPDSFIHDRVTGETTRVSVASDGTQGNNSSYVPSISADGRFVAFVSEASNLVDGDTNGVKDIFVHNRIMGETTRISVASDGTEGNLGSGDPFISTEGRYVAFASDASNLVNGDTNEMTDAFVHDRGSGGIYSISGKIKVGDTSNGISGITISTDDGHTATTDSNGYYRFQGLTEGTYTVTPLNDCYTFSPASYTISLIGDVTGKDFSGFGIITIPHIEVNQATQNTNNTVPLINDKLAMVRVCVQGSSSCSPIPLVTGQIDVSGPNGSAVLNPITPITIEASPDNWTTKRSDLANSLNFLVDPIFITNTVSIFANVGTAENSEIFTLSDAIEPTILLLPIKYRYQTIDLDQINSWYQWAQEVFPTSRIQPIILNTESWFTPLTCDDPFSRNECRDKSLIVWLNNLYTNLDDQLHFEKQTYLVGLLPSIAMNDFPYGGHSDPTWDNGLGHVAWFIDTRTIENSRGFAHEIDHLMGRMHPESSDTRNDWPFTHNYFIHEFGIDLTHDKGWRESCDNTMDPDNDGGIKCPYWDWDYMSYFGSMRDNNVWTSSWTYTQTYSDTLQPRLIMESVAMQEVPQQYILDSGLVFSDSHVILNPAWIITSTIAVDNPIIGTQYCFEARDSSGITVTSRCFDVSFFDDQGNPTWVDSFNISLPYSPNITRLVLMHGDQLLADRIASPNPPQVQVLSPNGGENWPTGTYQTISWLGSDLDEDPLIYDIFYSPDGTSWTPLAIDITSTQLTVNTNDVSGGETAVIYVMATDGFNTTLDESDTSFTVERKPPMALIIHPSDDLTWPPNEPIILRGDAYDAEDYSLEGTALHWSSDRDGDLGLGRTKVFNLSYGEHLITLTITDGDGNSTSQTIHIFVGYRIFMPLSMRR